MYAVHGTYPMQDWKCGWQHICELAKEEAEELISTAIVNCGRANEDDHITSNGEVLLNKGFRVVFSKLGLVFAVYAKDWSYRLLACPLDQFLEDMRERETKIFRNPPKVLLGHEWIKPGFPVY